MNKIYSDTTIIHHNKPDVTFIQEEHIVEARFSGDWLVTNKTPTTKNVFSCLVPLTNIKKLKIKTDSLTNWDSSLLLVITQLIHSAYNKKLEVDDKEVPPGIRNLVSLALTFSTNVNAQKHKKNKTIFFIIGEYVLKIPQSAQKIFAFLGEMTLSLHRFFTKKSACTKQNILNALQECSAEALPIVSLISILVGLILAFVGVIQLRMFGAEIYVSSLVAIGMTRIMGAVMTGIILAGRTGASYAAVIGTMQVNEEIDALTTLGITSSDFLVLPRLIALTCMTPLLVIYSDFMGILGGFIVGCGILGIDPLEYFNFTKESFEFSNFYVGLMHGAVFGIIIALTSCYHGLQCEKTAAAVGLATTNAVVYSIVGIVIATACLTLFFNALNI